MSAYTLNVSLDRLVCGHVGARLMALCKSGCAYVQCCGLWADCALCTAVCHMHYAVSSTVDYVSKTIVLSYQSIKQAD